MPVRVRHPEPTDGITLEIKLDQYCGLVAHDPPVVSRFNDNGLRSCKLKSAAIRVLNMDLTTDQESDVSVHTEIGTDNLLHVRGPSKPRRVDHALHAAGAGPHDINLGTADCAALAAGNGRKQWIIVAHEVLHADSSVAVEFYQIVSQTEGVGIGVGRDERSGEPRAFGPDCEGSGDIVNYR